MEDKWIHFFEEYAQKTDKINKRITFLCVIISAVLAIVVTAYCVRDTQISHNYFYSSYPYGNMTQSSNSGDNQTAIGGVNENG